MDEGSLTAFVKRVSGSDHQRVEEDFGEGFVRLRISEAERRQALQDIRGSEDIVLELLRNARDAHASHIFLATSREGARRTILCIDDGEGIPASMHRRVFEPRVTSKLDSSHLDTWGLHGRGMALYSISQAAIAAHVVASSPGQGTAIWVETSIDQVGERRDQSTFPTFVRGEGNGVAVRGPRNILRTCCEFALAERARCTVHVGSSTEVAAALFHHACGSLSSFDRAFGPDPASLPVAKRLGLAADPASFARIAATLGLSFSERSARRILDGAVAPAPGILDLVSIEAPPTRSNAPRHHRPDACSVSLSAEDRAQLAEGVRAAYAPLAQRFYLEPDVEPLVRVSGDRLLISVPLASQREGR
ncbi:ATP-binding protein [Eggerthellaceae bacterium zg-1084]|uniref:ATP-binding protein n=1 Tax=Berryella wangjianweii TaxID=2734634 RepID=UPI001552EA5C|nr:ATP-binding protein [Berryella wangjianweii]NPD30290.1 ATP-binding protein [Berryella wangjianweii]NPD32593.1 ATP-binding protein [Eggerthellaceae bacterium zg-997]